MLSENKNQKHKIEMLGKSIKNVSREIIINLAKAIYKHIDELEDNSNGATMLGIRERCIFIISYI